MQKFLILYSGGMAPANGDEAAASMKVWNEWFERLGDSVVDMGNPLGSAKTVSEAGIHEGSDGNVSNGWGVLQADNLDDAAALVNDCPIISEGGKVHVYDLVAM